jgi:hypothetical protein
MSGLGFSLKAMLLATATVALAISGMVNPSLWWGSICLSYLTLMLTYSLLAATIARGHLQAFWIGFAIVGWTYGAMLYAPLLDVRIGQRLVTTKLLAKVQPLFGKVYIPAYPTHPPAQELALDLMQEEFLQASPPTTAGLVAPQWDPFQRAGHMLFVIWAAGIAGILARRLSARNSSSSNLAA